MRSRNGKMRIAMAIRIAARVATGKSSSSAIAGISDATAAAASRPASWVRPDAAATAAVRGGLALIGNAPTKPATMLPAPTPRKSRFTFTW